MAGCIRLITSRESGIASVAALKGKTVGTFSMASLDKNFISILAVKQGTIRSRISSGEPTSADLLGVALAEG